ncbi:MAG TPA: DHA2 family efflux MFS transporter permease subunit [Candidatus Limnocylindrales bacterium]|nr:DHA2 family efflux MFS transporter permease subunit [Candidatus Limnocylindrales bacterium]
MTNEPLTSFRKWAITFSVMIITVMQVLDTSITNVALPHMQGSLSAGVEEMAWVITSYLAANAVVIPATGFLTAYFGRRRFFLICTTIFTVSSFLSGIAPNLEFLVAMRVLQGLGGGPVIPMAQATMWEIFPLRQRGTAMAVWGVGIMMAPILGPTLGGWIVDSWSWRWIFYVNLPIGLLGFVMASVFLFDSPHHRKPKHVDVLGIVLMVIGFGALQLAIDQGEKFEWFDSGYIVGLFVLAVCAIMAFLIRELTTPDPILDLSVFNDRNFAVASIIITLVAVAFTSSLLLLALYTQKMLGYDAWTSGLVLAPGGLGTMIALVFSGRLVARVDQRLMLLFGLGLNAFSLFWMSNVTLGMDYWSLAAPRFVQGFGQGFIFPPLQTLALGLIQMHRLSNATAAFNVVRNAGGSIGVAMITTLLARRAQYHQSTLAGHVTQWSPETAERLRDWTAHFMQHGADTFTAERRATAMLYRELVGQAQVLTYGDEFWLLAMIFVVALPLLPLMRRVRAEENERARAARPEREDGPGGRVDPLPAPEPGGN